MADTSATREIETTSVELAPPAERGRTTIADKVVDRIAAAATTEVDVVLRARGGWTRLMGKNLPSASAVVAGKTCKVAVEVAVPWTTPLPASPARPVTTSRSGSTP